VESQTAEVPLQQSHHCGIETMILLLVNPDGISSNRTIVGLKLPEMLVVSSITCRSNRTIVGLKPTKASIPERSTILQQSHHCGIETLASKLKRGWMKLAAIAPLWD